MVFSIWIERGSPMTRREAISVAVPTVVGCVFAAKSLADDKPEPGTFFRNDPSIYKTAKNGHGGIGTVSYGELTDRKALTSQFLFLHRGILMPKSSLGEHVHRRMEEMYVILSGTAQFRINGHSAQLPTGGMALCSMRSSHGIYNHTDEPIQFMNWGISYANRKYDAVDFGDNLVDAKIESPPPFLWTYLEPDLLNPVPGMYKGKGEILKRILWTTDKFQTNWGFMNHYVIPPGHSIGYHKHEVMEEVYYFLSGSGSATVNDKTFKVREGDAITCFYGGSHGVYNNGKENLGIMVVAVSKEKGVFDGITLDDDLTGR